ncbi:glycosyltransferase [Alteromonadaceae bacterium BrNp21-10]|nr:glycosyltransferase [Alteromonadaceae bacterium BrNp21-10]
MKNILILSNMYPSKLSPSYGIFVRNIEKSLLNDGFNVDVIAIRGRRTSILGKLIAYLQFYFTAFLRLLFTKRVVYLHFVAHTSLPLIIVRCIRKLFIVSHVHGGDVMVAKHENALGEKIKERLAKLVLQRSNLIIVPSKYFANFVSQKFNLVSSKLIVSPSGGVDTNKFVPIDKIMGKKNDSLYLGYVGRLDAGKGVDTLIKAFSLLSTTQNVKLAIVGGGKKMQEYANMVASLGGQSRCTFLGETKQSHLPNIMQIFDYLIFPSELDESLGLVGLEAMACGVPIVTSGRAGIGEYFVDGLNGIQFESGNIKDLSARLKLLPSIDSEQYRELCINARLTALQFDREKVEKELSIIFEEI